MKRLKIDIDQIDLSDGRFRTSPVFNLDRMKLSLQEAGLLQPPLVSRRGNRYLLVSGWKRVLACRELSLSPIEVLVDVGRGDLELFLNAFYENLACRDFSPIEKAEAVFRLNEFGEPAEKIWTHYLPLLDAHPTVSALETLLAIARFEPNQKVMLAEEGIPFSSLERLVDFDTRERDMILPLLVPLSQNKQKEVLEDLFEISRREERAVKEILEKEEIRRIQRSESLSPLQKSDNVRVLLREARYPLHSQWLNAFESVAKRIPWPKGARIQPSPHFEGDDLLLSFRFRNKKEFQSCLAGLREAGSHPDFGRLFLEPRDD